MTRLDRGRWNGMNVISTPWHEMELKMDLKRHMKRMVPNVNANNRQKNAPGTRQGKGNGGRAGGGMLQHQGGRRGGKLWRRVRPTQNEELRVGRPATSMACLAKTTADSTVQPSSVSWRRQRWVKQQVDWSLGVTATCIDLLVFVIQLQTVQPFPKLLAVLLLLFLPASTPKQHHYYCL